MQVWENSSASANTVFLFSQIDRTCNDGIIQKDSGERSNPPPPPPSPGPQSTDSMLKIVFVDASRQQRDR